ncbi:CbtA family protein [Prosthecomicrobium sp. N25]|uniref:CbtA family protein n=1 Tax=Prosthecomicrobium sp. N25 TaxID=3129254 RepID=UPI0030779643
MIGRVLWVGLLAGLVAGLAVAALQHVTTTPLILAAEAYEAQGHHHGALPDGGVLRLAHSHGGTATDASAPAPAETSWKPADGIERTAVTSLATVLTAMGYALILVAGMLVAGDAITVRSALAWGAAGFAATGLATGLGLAPELPGSAAGDLVARQTWWIVTAVATGAGLYGLFRLATVGAKAGGAILIAVPHIVGAPKPAAFESTVPAELAAHFASTSLAVHAVLWLLVAASVALLWERTGRTA